jgi:DNA-binding response OmpR family regulator
LDARTVLIVDADPRAAALVALGLQRAGYVASVVNSADEAIVRLEEDVVDLVICDTALARDGSGTSDGFSLLAVIKAHPRLGVPVIVLSSSSAVADKVRGLQLGAEDFLCKPLSLHELVLRVRVLFARRAQKAIITATRVRLSGSTHDLSVIDLMQAFEVATKSGTLKLRNGALEATLVFRHGALQGATLGKLTGQDAAFRAILWGDVSFEVVFAAAEAIAPSAHPVSASTAAVILEGLRRADDWGRLLKELPPLGAYLSVREDELIDRLADIPDEVDGIIKLIDGSRTLQNVIDESPFDDLSTLETLAKLRGSGLLVVVNKPDGPSMSLSRRVRSLDDDPFGNQSFHFRGPTRALSR